MPFSSPESVKIPELTAEQLKSICLAYLASVQMPTQTQDAIETMISLDLEKAALADGGEEMTMPLLRSRLLKWAKVYKKLESNSEASVEIVGTLLRLTNDEGLVSFLLAHKEELRLILKACLKAYLNQNLDQWMRGNAATQLEKLLSFDYEPEDIRLFRELLDIWKLVTGDKDLAVDDEVLENLVSHYRDLLHQEED